MNFQGQVIKKAKLFNDEHYMKNIEEIERQARIIEE